MLIFIEIIGEYGNWTDSPDSACLTKPASAENMIDHAISAKLQNRTSTKATQQFRKNV